MRNETPEPAAAGPPVPHSGRPGFGFPQTARLKKPAQFDAVYALKKSASDGVLVVFAGPNAVARPRVGLSVSRKVGNAVVRNRWKRLMREAFRLSRHDLPACDYVLVPRRGLPEPPTQDAVRASLVKLTRDAARRVERASRPREGAEVPPRPPPPHGDGSPGAPS